MEMTDATLFADLSRGFHDLERAQANWASIVTMITIISIVNDVSNFVSRHRRDMWLVSKCHVFPKCFKNCAYSIQQ